MKVGETIRPVYVAQANRSPIGKKNGGLRDVHSVELGSQVLKAVLERAGLRLKDVDPRDIHLTAGCATQTGKQGFNVGKNIAQAVGMRNLTGNSNQFLCGSSALAQYDLATKIAARELELGLAVGVEAMSPPDGKKGGVGMGSDVLLPVNGSSTWKILRNVITNAKLGPKIGKVTMHRDAQITPMNRSAQFIAENRGITRREMDEYALRSHQLALEARAAGLFDREIVPIYAGRGRVVDSDEGIKDFKMSTLEREKGRWGEVTKFHCSQESDGAAAMLLASEDALAQYDLTPKAKILANAVSASVSGDQKEQLTAVADAIEQVLDKTGLTVDQIDKFEINEAFAPVVLAAVDETPGLYLNKVNKNGGAIALGHPLGTSGLRLPTTLIHDLERNNQKYGLSVLCVGGGQAIATIYEICA